MIDVVVELAGEHPMIFLGLVGLGLLLSVILLIAAIKVTKLILKAVYFLFTVALVLLLSMITLIAAEHVYSALTYEPPPDNPSAPGPEPTDPEPEPYQTYDDPAS